jgi:hypothetical protein
MALVNMAQRSKWSRHALVESLFMDVVAGPRVLIGRASMDLDIGRGACRCTTTHGSLIIMSNLFQLAYLTLLARLSNDLDSVDACLFAVSVTIHNEEHQRADVLELDES